jgi:mono/diheme cytochrome c family protein
LGASDKEILISAMDDKDAQVRKAAIWIGESFLKSGDDQMLARLEKLKDDESYDVRAQLLLSLYAAKGDKAKAIAKDISSKSPKNEMLAGVQNSLERNESVKTLGIKLGKLDEADRKRVIGGAEIFRSLCASCHGPDGKGLPTKVAPSLLDDPRALFMGSKDTMIRIVLHGLTGPVKGKKVPDGYAGDGFEQ